MPSEAAPNFFLARVRLQPQIDRRKRFVPESMTPLFHTPVYSRLTPDQALRYNQLNGLYFNELVGQFEETLGREALGRMVREDSLGLPAALRNKVAGFLKEEIEHQVAFRRLNRLCEPAWYADHAQAIVPPSWAATWPLRLATRQLKYMSCLLWMILAIEERAVWISIRSRETGEDLEPNFSSLHRIHAEDEERHILIDSELLERIHGTLPLPLRKANARVFAWAVGAFLYTPGRASSAIIAQLIREFPELRPLRKRMLSELAALGGTPSYQQMMYSREATPRLFAAFDRYPEFHRMSDLLPSYWPQEVVPEHTF